MVSDYRNQLAKVAGSIKWAYQTLSANGYYERKAREKLPFKQMSKMAFQSKWNILRQGRWPHDSRRFPLCYRLGENRRIEVDQPRSTALIAALEEVLGGVAVTIGAANHDFNAYSLRKIIREPEFYQGKVWVPDAEGKNFHWETGKHPVIINKDLADRLANRPTTMFRVPLDKIREIFEIRRTQIRSGNTSLKEIEERVHVPWQTVDALLRNPNCKQVVGEQLWKTASPIVIGGLSRGRPRVDQSA